MHAFSIYFPFLLFLKIVMKGYWQNPEATAAAIWEYEGKRLFRTGDLGKLDQDNYLKVVGRAKEQYKLMNGKFIVPGVIQDVLILSPFIAQAAVFGINQFHNVALLYPNWANIEQWAAKKGVKYEGNVRSLATSPLLHEEINREIHELSAKLKSYEVPREWELIPEPFTVENGMLTPKLSLKRHNIEKRYKDVIDRLYVQLKKHDTKLSP